MLKVRRVDGHTDGQTPFLKCENKSEEEKKTSRKTVRYRLHSGELLAYMPLNHPRVSWQAVVR